MKLTDLRGILHYIPQFREKTFVLAIDSEIVGDERFATLLVDIALLWSLNIRIVLVHGAAEPIRRLAAERGITPSNTDGTGITDAATATKLAAIEQEFHAAKCSWLEDCAAWSCAPKVSGKCS